MFEDGRDRHVLSAAGTPGGATAVEPSTDGPGSLMVVALARLLLLTCALQSVTSQLIRGEKENWGLQSESNAAIQKKLPPVFGELRKHANALKLINDAFDRASGRPVEDAGMIELRQKRAAKIEELKLSRKKKLMTDDDVKLTESNFVLEVRSLSTSEDGCTNFTRANLAQIPGIGTYSVTLDVPAGMPLYQLHEAVLAPALGRRSAGRSYQFTEPRDGSAYGIDGDDHPARTAFSNGPADLTTRLPLFGRELIDDRNVKLFQLLRKKGDHLLYLFDLSEGWNHDIKLKHIKPPRPKGKKAQTKVSRAVPKADATVINAVCPTVNIKFGDNKFGCPPAEPWSFDIESPITGKHLMTFPATGRAMQGFCRMVETDALVHQGMDLMRAANVGTLLHTQGIYFDNYNLTVTAKSEKAALLSAYWFTQYPWRRVKDRKALTSDAQSRVNEAWRRYAQLWPRGKRPTRKVSTGEQIVAAAVVADRARQEAARKAALEAARAARQRTAAATHVPGSDEQRKCGVAGEGPEDAAAAEAKFDSAGQWDAVAEMIKKNMATQSKK